MGKLKTELKQFVENSSVKGLPKIFKVEDLARKILWIIALIIGVTLGVYQVYQLCVLYFSYSTSRRTIESSEAPMFPDITVCNANPIGMFFTAIMITIRMFWIYMIM